MFTFIYTHNNIDTRLMELHDTNTYTIEETIETESEREREKRSKKKKYKSLHWHEPGTM